MSTRRLTVARIGNSRGVRIPATTLARYRIGEAVIMEEREDGILLRPVRAPERKLSFEDTARAMAAEVEDWGDSESWLGDGIEHLPWEYPTSEQPAVPRVAVQRVAEPSPGYIAESPKKRRKGATTSAPTPRAGKTSKRTEK
jgi:antitoxin component of MazEF toxin-antitoxin module